MGLITSFITGVASSLTANYFEKQVLPNSNKNKFIGFGKLSKYKAMLSRDLSNMPFIYKDLNLKVSENYVHIEYKTLNTDLVPLNTKAIESSTYEVLKDHKHILIVGAAGIGKTTFQRFAIHCLLNKHIQADFIHKSEKIVPIYVPMKIIDNSKPLPIYSYITSNIDLFKGQDGAKLLSKLSEKKRLFLFLDGYDEMSFMGDNKNFAGQEIEYIWRTSKFKASSGLLKTSKDLLEFYKTISSNRVWLASRKEFFTSNPLKLSEPSTHSTVFPLQFVGIGSNRVALIKTIFERYKENSDDAKELLDEEFFVSEIDDSRDKELIELSHNPLFLTVMCFVYCHQVMKTKSDEFLHFESISELILECINLLLHDLDEKKARDLSKAKQKALMKRRNDFTDEKLDFLMFFATQLYLENKNTFDEAYINDKVIYYFSTISDSKNKDAILEDLNNPTRSNPNLPQQLIYSGLFSLFSSGGNKNYYDFPHRRFRETLTIAQITSPNTFINLLKHYGSPNVSELFELLKKSSSKLDSELLDRTLEKALKLNELNVVQGFIECKPEQYNISRVVEEFLIYALQHTSCEYNVCSAALDFKPTVKMNTILTSVLSKSISEEKISVFCFAYSLLLQLPDLCDDEQIKATEIACFQKPKLFLKWYELTKIHANNTIESMIKNNIDLYLSNPNNESIWNTCLPVRKDFNYEGYQYLASVLDYLVNCSPDVFEAVLTHSHGNRSMLFLTEDLSKKLVQLTLENIKELEVKKAQLLVLKGSKLVQVEFEGEIVEETIAMISLLYSSLKTDQLITREELKKPNLKVYESTRMIAKKAASYADAEDKNKVNLKSNVNARRFTSLIRKEVLLNLQLAKVSTKELNFLIELSSVFRNIKKSNMRD